MRRLVPLLLVPVVLMLAVPAPVDAQQPKRGGVIRIAEREAPSYLDVPQWPQYVALFTWLDK
jgi:hypothetical protein